MNPYTVVPSIWIQRIQPSASFVFMRETVSTTLTALQLLLNVTQVSNARLDLAGAAHRPHCGTGWANNSSSTCQGLPGPTENSSLLDRLTLCRAVNELFSSSCCRAPDIAPSHVTQAAAAPNRHLSGRLPPTSALSVKHGRRLNGAAIACYTSIGGVLGLHNDSLKSMLWRHRTSYKTNQTTPPRLAPSSQLCSWRPSNPTSRSSSFFSGRLPPTSV